MCIGNSIAQLKWLLDKRCCSHNGNSTRWTLHIQHTEKNSFTFVSQSSHTVKMPHQLFEKTAKKANGFIVNIHNGTFCHSSLADCYYWGCHRCHAIAVLIKHWKCLRFFSHSHFICLLCFFCYFLLCGKGLQKTLNKTHCYCFKLHFASVIHSFVWISVYQVSI